jgi:hypothetical protein
MAKPPLKFGRPTRNRVDAQSDGLRSAPTPAIDLESPEVRAFSLRGRAALGSPQEAGIRADDGQNRLKLSSLIVSPSIASTAADEITDDPWRHVAVKLPTMSGRKLSEIADLRCSKRTRVAVELLERPLRELASDHRAGDFPPLRRVSAGVSRFGIALVLPQELADDLRFVVECRSAVKAQILARLLVPEIDALYAKEVIARR